MTVTALATAVPDRYIQSQTEFNINVASMMAWFPGFVAELNATVDDINIKAADAAAGGASAAIWVSGAAYTAGQTRWSPANFGTYRRKTTSSAGVTDPSIDTTNWASTYVMTAPVFAGLMTGGSLTLAGMGARISADFSNTTLANRCLFKSSTVNGSTNIEVIPNGTSAVSSVTVNNNSDPDNGSRCQIFTSAAAATISSTKRGTGSYLPLSIQTGDLERIGISAAGAVTVPQTLDVTGVLTATAGVVFGSFTTATRPSHANGKAIRVGDGAGGQVCQMSHGGAWIYLG